MKGPTNWQETSNTANKRKQSNKKSNRKEKKGSFLKFLGEFISYINL